MNTRQTNKHVETSYYPDIKECFERDLRSNLKALGCVNVKVFACIGELQSNLIQILENDHELEHCLGTFARSTPKLFLDIFALVTDGTRFELVILEIKRKQSVGLNEWSQLVGYCLVSGAKYGLLVNIDNDASFLLSEILATKPSLSQISTIFDDTTTCHNLGMMTWNSITKDFEYRNLGSIKSQSELSRRLAEDFS